MIRRYSVPLMVAALLVVGYSALNSAEPAADVVGTWVFHVSIQGASPCECVQIATFHADSSLEGPGNDQFTGQARGVWAKAGANKVNFTFVENSFNHDGTAAGLYTISGSMNLTGSASGSGTSSFTLTNNSGATVASGKATFTATRLRAAP
jgi:hypothetical protein